MLRMYTPYTEAEPRSLQSHAPAAVTSAVSRASQGVYASRGSLHLEIALNPKPETLNP